MGHGSLSSDPWPIWPIQFWWSIRPIDPWPIDPLSALLKHTKNKWNLYVFTVSHPHQERLFSISLNPKFCTRRDINPGTQSISINVYRPTEPTVHPLICSEILANISRTTEISIWMSAGHKYRGILIITLSDNMMNIRLRYWASCIYAMILIKDNIMKYIPTKSVEPWVSQ